MKALNSNIKNVELYVRSGGKTPLYYSVLRDLRDLRILQRGGNEYTKQLTCHTKDDCPMPHENLYGDPWTDDTNLVIIQIPGIKIPFCIDIEDFKKALKEDFNYTCNPDNKNRKEGIIYNVTNTIGAHIWVSEKSYDYVAEGNGNGNRKGMKFNATPTGWCKAHGHNLRSRDIVYDLTHTDLTHTSSIKLYGISKSDAIKILNRENRGN